MNTWMNSPAHRDNIVDERFTEIGVGTAKGEYQGFETVFVVQLFGTPALRPSNPVAPANDATIVSDTLAQPPLSDQSEPALVETDSLVAEALVEVDLPVEEAAVLAVAPPAVTPVPVNEPVSEATTTLATSEIKSDVVTATETLALNRTLVTDSSGLPAAPLALGQHSAPTAGTSLQALATQPNRILQGVYTTVVLLVTVLLTTSIIRQGRQQHAVQIAYSVILLLVMVGLSSLHVWLTAGAVVA
jgi:hypothetical protein